MNHNKHKQHSNRNGRGQLCALARAWIFKIDPAEGGITTSYQSTKGAANWGVWAPPRPALMGAIPIFTYRHQSIGSQHQSRARARSARARVERAPGRSPTRSPHLTSWNGG